MSSFWTASKVTSQVPPTCGEGEEGRGKRRRRRRSRIRSEHAPTAVLSATQGEARGGGPRHAGTAGTRKRCTKGSGFSVFTFLLHNPFVLFEYIYIFAIYMYYFIIKQKHLKTIFKKSEELITVEHETEYHHWGQVTQLSPKCPTWSLIPVLVMSSLGSSDPIHGAPAVACAKLPPGAQERPKREEQVSKIKLIYRVRVNWPHRPPPTRPAGSTERGVRPGRRARENPGLHALVRGRASQGKGGEEDVHLGQEGGDGALPP